MNTQDKKPKSLLSEAQRFRKSIGTKNESCLHRTLKFQYAGSGGKTEVKTGNYIADCIRKDGEFIEIQTGSFAPLVKKVKEFASINKVRIIHPVAVSRQIDVYSQNGKLLYRRKSPIHGSKWNIFNALLHAPELPLVKNLIIELALIDITEKRIKDGKGSWRRKGISLHDKEIKAWHECLVYSKPKDYLDFIPFKKNEEFTVSSLAKKAEIKEEMSRKALYVLTKIKVVKRIGKKGNAYIYVRR